MFIKAKQRRASGFTIIELMVGSAVAGIALAVTMAVSFYTGRSMASLTDSVSLGHQSRSVIDRMSQKIRQAEAVTSFSPHSITFKYLGTNLTYTYVPSDKMLVEIEKNKKTVLLENCRSLSFDLFKRNPVTNSFEQFPSADTLAEAKLVQVVWACETKAVGKANGSSELISSKIVLRSK